MLFAAESQYFSPTPSAKITGNREVTAGRYRYVNVEKTSAVWAEDRLLERQSREPSFCYLGEFWGSLAKVCASSGAAVPDYIGFVVQVSQNLKCGGIDAVKEGWAYYCIECSARALYLCMYKFGSAHTDTHVCIGVNCLIFNKYMLLSTECGHSGEDARAFT